MNSAFRLAFFPLEYLFSCFKRRLPAAQFPSQAQHFRLEMSGIKFNQDIPLFDKSALISDIDDFPFIPLDGRGDDV